MHTEKYSINKSGVPIYRLKVSENEGKWWKMGKKQKMHKKQNIIINYINYYYSYIILYKFN